MLEDSFVEPNDESMSWRGVLGLPEGALRAATAHCGGDAVVGDAGGLASASVRSCGATPKKRESFAARIRRARKSSGGGLAAAWRSRSRSSASAGGGEYAGNEGSRSEKGAADTGERGPVGSGGTGSEMSGVCECSECWRECEEECESVREARDGRGRGPNERGDTGVPGRECTDRRVGEMGLSSAIGEDASAIGFTLSVSTRGAGLASVSEFSLASSAAPCRDSTDPSGALNTSGDGGSEFDDWMESRRRRVMLRLDVTEVKVARDSRRFSETVVRMEMVSNVSSRFLCEWTWKSSVGGLSPKSYGRTLMSRAFQRRQHTSTLTCIIFFALRTFNEIGRAHV